MLCTLAAPAPHRTCRYQPAASLVPVRHRSARLRLSRGSLSKKAATAGGMAAIPAELLAAAQQAGQAHIFAGWNQLDDAQQQRLLQDATVSRALIRADCRSFRTCRLHITALPVLSICRCGRFRGPLWLLPQAVDFEHLSRAMAASQLVASAPRIVSAPYLAHHARRPPSRLATAIS